MILDAFKSAKPLAFDDSQKMATAGAPVDFRDSWRVFRIVAEFVDGYNFLKDLKREVTILGSARLPANNKYYKIAEELGQLLAKSGFTTITGGGPGIMEAANKGAYTAGGESVGLNIQLPFEQRINPYVKKFIAFNYFFTRKVMLTSPANAFVFFPGGFGTMDEFFEVVDGMEQGHMPKSPIVLVGKEFWSPLVNFLKSHARELVDAIPLDVVDSWIVTDSAEEAYDAIKDSEDRVNSCAVDDVGCAGGADWRIFRIMAELVSGFEFLTGVNNDVTVLGTKSLGPDSKYYQAAEKLGGLLARNNFSTITGGGPGIMEATNKGAFEAGGASLGINMRFESGERLNKYLTKSLGFFFPFVRKLIITAPSKAFVFFPGGFGTMHQLFEMLTLQETKKYEQMPTILYGSEFWGPMKDYVNMLNEKFHTISKGDEELFTVVDSPEEVISLISK